MNWRFWRSTHAVPITIVIGVIVGSVLLFYVGLLGVHLEYADGA